MIGTLLPPQAEKGGGYVYTINYIMNVFMVKREKDKVIFEIFKFSCVTPTYIDSVC